MKRAQLKAPQKEIGRVIRPREDGVVATGGFLAAFYRLLLIK